MGKSKNELRSAYTNFFVNDAQKVIKDWNEVNRIGKPGKFSRKYREYTKLPLILLAVGFVLTFIGLFIIGFPLIIVATLMLVFMPADLKKEADAYNHYTQRMRNASVEEMANFTDPELELKSVLMGRFLSIFGDFKWQKRNSYININNLVILPDNLSFDTDDCIMGNYDNANIKITEVYFGMNAFFRTIKNSGEIMYKLTPVFAIIFFSMLAFAFLGNSKNVEFIILIVFTFYVIFFMFGFFTPLYFLSKFSKERGLIIEIDMNKKFEGDTIIFENGTTNRIINKKLLKNYEKTSIEDVEFNNKYSIYTTNEIEARYVLTTLLIERLKHINFRFYVKYIRFRFINNRITIFINVYKDLFKMADMIRDTDMKMFNVLFDEIYSVLSLIDDLKLNRKTGL